MQKNVASQKLVLLAFDATTGAPKTGDAANLTAYVSKDAAAPAALADTSATELDATNLPGAYAFDVAQGETNADMLVFGGKSSTANIKLDSLVVFTRPPSFNTLVIASTKVAATVAAGDGVDAAAILAKLAGITLLKHWLGAIAGKQAADATAQTEMRASGAGSGSFDPTTDSVEALRDRGDAAWITNTAASIRAAIGMAAADLDTQLAAHLAALGIIDDFVDDLEGRLTGARAGYLDNLSAGAVAQAATALSTAQWTNARAALLDQLVAFAAGKYNSVAFGNAVAAIYAAVALKSSGAGTTNPKVLGADGTTIIDATADASGNVTASTVTP